MSRYSNIQDFIESVGMHEDDIYYAIMDGVNAEDIPNDGTEPNRELFQLWSEATIIRGLLRDISDAMFHYTV